MKFANNFEWHCEKKFFLRFYRCCWQEYNLDYPCRENADHMKNDYLGLLYIVFGWKDKKNDLITFDTLCVGLLIMEIFVQGKFFVQVSKECWAAKKEMLRKRDRFDFYYGICTSISITHFLYHVWNNNRVSLCELASHQWMHHNIRAHIGFDISFEKACWISQIHSNYY